MCSDHIGLLTFPYSSINQPQHCAIFKKLLNISLSVSNFLLYSPLLTNSSQTHSFSLLTQHYAILLKTHQGQFILLKYSWMHELPLQCDLFAIFTMLTWYQDYPSPGRGTSSILGTHVSSLHA